HVIRRTRTYGVFCFSSRRRHTRSKRDWSSDVCSSDLGPPASTTRAGRRVDVGAAPPAGAVAGSVCGSTGSTGGRGGAGSGAGVVDNDEEEAEDGGDSVEDDKVSAAAAGCTPDYQARSLV